MPIVPPEVSAAAADDIEATAKRRRSPDLKTMTQHTRPASGMPASGMPAKGAGWGGPAKGAGKDLSDPTSHVDLRGDVGHALHRFQRPVERGVCRDRQRLVGWLRGIDGASAKD